MCAGRVSPGSVRRARQDPADTPYRPVADRPRLRRGGAPPRGSPPGPGRSPPGRGGGAGVRQIDHAPRGGVRRCASCRAAAAGRPGRSPAPRPRAGSRPRHRHRPSGRRGRRRRSASRQEREAAQCPRSRRRGDGRWGETRAPRATSRPRPLEPHDPLRPAPVDRSPHHSSLRATARRRQRCVICPFAAGCVRIRHVAATSARKGVGNGDGDRDDRRAGHGGAAA